MNNLNAWKEDFAAFVKQLTPKDNVLLIHDKDTDGITSGIITAKAIERITGKPIALRWHLHDRRSPLSDALLSRIRHNKITWIFCTDFALDGYVQDFLRLPHGIRMVIFDHHTLENDIVDSSVMLVKPQLFQDEIDPSQWCTAKLCYDFWSGVADVSDLAWIASIGIIADANYKTWKVMVDESLRSFGLAVPDNIFLSDFAKASRLVYFAEGENNDNLTEVFDIFYHAKHPRDIYDSALKRFAPIEEEVNRLFDEHKEKALFMGNTVWYEIKTKYKIGSLVANRLSHELYPNKNVFVIMHIDDGGVGINARRQDFAVKMNDVMREATFGLKDATGGGHIPAAGGMVREEDFAEFKRRILLRLGDA